MVKFSFDKLKTAANYKSGDGFFSTRITKS